MLYLLRPSQKGIFNLNVIWLRLPSSLLRVVLGGLELGMHLKWGD